MVFKTAVSSYLFTAVRYKFFDWVDKQKVRADYAASLQVFIDQGEWVTDNHIAERELLNFVDQQIELLPEKMRAVFLLSYKENLSFKEIGLRLKISNKTAQNQANTALKILREKLGTFAVLLYIFH
ncbi:RNA polymerase sigma factor FliA [compost metagenome]